MKRIRSALLILIFAVSACDQAPDNDNSRTSAAAASEMSQSRESPHRERSRTKHGAIALSYELRGLPGTPRQFVTKPTCDAALKAAAEAQAKEDKKLGEQGILFPNRPPLDCFPLSTLDKAGGLNPNRRG